MRAFIDGWYIPSSMSAIISAIAFGERLAVGVCLRAAVQIQPVHFLRIGAHGFRKGL
jgi:hypothetical protein